MNTQGRTMLGYPGSISPDRLVSEITLSHSRIVHNRRKSPLGMRWSIISLAFFGFRYLVFPQRSHREKAMPDFMLPGIRWYHDPAFPTLRMTMFGVKSTCKDRWRQVLSEAARIEHKHVFNLEGGISAALTEEMVSHNLILVLPTSFQGSFNDDRQKRLLSLAGFVAHVKEKA